MLSMKKILQGIGIVFTLIASFLGLMYSLKGDILISGLVSLVIIVIEYFLIEKFIRSKSEITKNKFSALSIILWSIYVLLAIPISVFLLHTLNVEINAKKEIQMSGNKKLTDLNKMVQEYKSTVDKNLTTLSIELSNKLTLYSKKGNKDLENELMAAPFKMSLEELQGVNSANVSIKVRSLLNAKATKLIAIADTISKSNTNFTARYGGVFDGWARLQINYAFYELDNLLKKNKDSFANHFAQYSPYPTEKFTYEYSSEITNIAQPLALFMRHKPYYLLIALVLFHLLILFPYVIEPVAGVYIPPGNKPRVGGGIEL
jgi:hypothetical protein